MNVQELNSREAVRMDVYKVLSTCFTFPERRLCGPLENLERQLASLGSEALTDVVMMRSELMGVDYLETLQREFARLFIGPYRLPAPPYGSIYLEKERKIMGNSTMDVVGRYHEIGLDLAGTFRDAPDHIAAELEFMQVMIFYEIEAIQAQDNEALNRHLMLQKSFLNDHLGAWVPAFTDRVIHYAENSFFRHLGQVTCRFVAEDQEALSQLKTPQPLKHTK